MRGTAENGPNRSDKFESLLNRPQQQRQISEYCNTPSGGVNIAAALSRESAKSSIERS
jgi:hypothetical protein